VDAVAGEDGHAGVVAVVEAADAAADVRVPAVERNEYETARAAGAGGPDSVPRPGPPRHRGVRRRGPGHERRLATFVADSGRHLVGTDTIGHVRRRA
jgi:hypothetical protein